MSINRPPYIRIAEHYRSRIQSGDLTPGSLLPSLKALAQEHGVSAATAEKAVAQLRAEGLVRGIPGIGTEVVHQDGTAEHPTTPTGQERAAAVRGSGRIYRAGERAEITSATVVPAPEDVLHALDLEPGASAIRRERVTRTDDTVVSVSVSWFDASHAERAPQLLVADRIPRGTWAYLEEQASLRVVSGEDRLSARRASAQEAQQLGISAGEPVQVKRTILRTSEGTPVEYGVSLSAVRESVYSYEIT